MTINLFVKNVNWYVWLFLIKKKTKSSTSTPMNYDLGILVRNPTLNVERYSNYVRDYCDRRCYKHIVIQRYGCTRYDCFAGPNTRGMDELRNGSAHVEKRRRVGICTRLWVTTDWNDIIIAAKEFLCRRTQRFAFKRHVPHQVCAILRVCVRVRLAVSTTAAR